MTASELNASILAGFVANARFFLGDVVADRHHAIRSGRVVGFYSTRESPVGVTYESPRGHLMHAPQDELVLIKSGMDLPR